MLSPDCLLEFRVFSRVCFGKRRPYDTNGPSAIFDCAFHRSAVNSPRQATCDYHPSLNEFLGKPSSPHPSYVRNVSRPDDRDTAFVQQRDVTCVEDAYIVLPAS